MTWLEVFLLENIDGTKLCITEYKIDSVSRTLNVTVEDLRCMNAECCNW